MRLKTHELWEDFWRSLHFYEHAWQNKSEFHEWTAGATRGGRKF